jgi:aminoglycoside phosphotransferase (APT) family kinase protein
MHAGQLSVPVGVVAALLADQFPSWAGLPIWPVASDGTVNAIFRVGDRLSARFPLQPRDVAATWRWLESEAAAARQLVGRTSVPTPEPVALGQPGRGYPLPWAVQTWLPGAVATSADFSGSIALAHDLARFIASVRAIDTDGRTFSGSGRGGELSSYDAYVRSALERSAGLLDVAGLTRVWAVLRTAPRHGVPDQMTHGDLMPGNVLVSAGRLAAVIDVGGSGPADPALDLVGAWHLFEARARQALRDDLGCDDAQWQRGMAWAFAQSIGLVWYYVESNPVMCAIGRRTLDRLADEIDAEPGDESA